MMLERSLTLKGSPLLYTLTLLQLPQDGVVPHMKAFNHSGFQPLNPPPPMGGVQAANAVFPAGSRLRHSPKVGACSSYMLAHLHKGRKGVAATIGLLTGRKLHIHAYSGTTHIHTVKSHLQSSSKHTRDTATCADTLPCIAPPRFWWRWRLGATRTPTRRSAACGPCLR